NAGAARGVVLAPAAVEDRDLVMAEILESPVDAGGAAELGGIGTPGHDNDVVVTVDAKFADELDDLLERRKLAGHALNLGAPACAGIGSDDRALDIRIGAKIGGLDLVADVDDDDVFLAGVSLQP